MNNFETLTRNKREVIHPLAPPQRTHFSIPLQDVSRLNPYVLLAETNELLGCSANENPEDILHQHLCNSCFYEGIICFTSEGNTLLLCRQTEDAVSSISFMGS